VLAAAIREIWGRCVGVRVASIDNLSIPQLKARFSEARAREYQELIQEIHALSGIPVSGKARRVSGRLRNRFRK